MKTVLTKHQVKNYDPRKMEDGNFITAEVRHDDCCGNGHNSFAITAEIKSPYGRNVACGCCHEDVAKAFPELVPFLKWHLCATDGPMHYLANALYWAGQSGWCDGRPGSPPNADHLKSTIVYGALPEDAGVDPMALAKEGRLADWLKSRLPNLLIAFERDVESLGLKF